MKRISFITVFLLLAGVTSGQSYTKLLFDLAFEQLENGDTAAFEKTYPQIFTAYLKDNTPYRPLTEAVERGEYETAFRLLEETAEEDILIPELLNDPALAPLRDREEWKAFRAMADSLDRIQRVELRDELLEMQYTDQSIRLLMQEAARRYGSQNAFGIRERMKKIDSLNIVRLESMLDRYGWLGAEEVGEYGNNTYFLVVQHIDDLRIQDQYLPVLEEALGDGRADPWQYAFLVDRIRMNRGEKQLYGTQKILMPDPADSYVVPLEDPDRVDERRESVGLGSLAEDLEEEGMSWDLEAYKARLPEIERLFQEYVKNRK